MSPQADYVVSNGTGAAVRSDINGQLAAIVSNNSGASAPATTYAYMLWADTSTNLLKLRNGANSAWITVGDLTAANLGLAALASPTFTGTATIPTLTVSTAANIPLGSAASPTLYFTGDSNTGLYSPGADQVALSTGGTGRLFIDSSGRCGIGVSSPQQSIDTSGSIRLSSGGSRVIDFLQNVNAAAYTGPGFYSSSSIGYGVASGGTHRWIGIDGNTEIMRLDSSGRLGIGVTSVSNTLHIKQTGDTYGDGIAIQAASGTARRLYIGVDHATGEGAIGTDTHDLRLEATGARSVTFKTNGSERARVDSSGRWLLGTSSSRGAYAGNLEIEATSAAATIAVTRNSNDAYPAYLFLAKSRSTSVGGNTIVASGDELGNLSFIGSDGVGPKTAATINCYVDATPGTNDMPGRLVFSTTADGASSPTERVRISNNGNINLSSLSVFYPTTDNAVKLGDNGFRWSAVWAANGTIQTSDQRAKSDIATATLGSDFIKSLRPVSYKWIEGGKRDTGERDEHNNYIYESVPGTRTHWGFIAQEVKQAVDATGVDFGGWVLTDKDDPDSQQALRYDQFIAPLTKALQEALAEIDVLKAKVAALESA